MRRGRYRMTPARRAALRKAQLASARKRRRKDVAYAVGRGAIKLGSAFIAIQTSRYMANPRALGRDYKDAKNAINKRRVARRERKNPTPVVKRSQYSGMSWYG